VGIEPRAGRHFPNPSHDCYGSSRVPVFYYVFDVLVLAGRSVMSEPLSVRRDLLRSRILPKLAEPIRQSPELNAGLPELIEAVRAHRLEGLVAKRLDSVYEPGQRSGAWRKMRINQGQEFVVGGYTPSPKNFDALIANDRLLDHETTEQPCRGTFFCPVSLKKGAPLTAPGEPRRNPIY